MVLVQEYAVDAGNLRALSAIGACGVAPNLPADFTATELVLSRRTSGFALRPTGSDIVRDRGAAVLSRG